MFDCIYRYSACVNISHSVFILNAEDIQSGKSPLLPPEQGGQLQRRGPFQTRFLLSESPSSHVKTHSSLILGIKLGETLSTLPHLSFKRSFVEFKFETCV
jgi:hypothetical protein